MRMGSACATVHIFFEKFASIRGWPFLAVVELNRSGPAKMAWLAALKTIV